MAFFNLIIPTFNSERTIERAVESVEGQTFSDYKIIIVDDMSTDGTRNILEELSTKYSNITVLLPHEKHYNGGARNLGVGYSNNCEYLLFLDSDDELADEHIFQNLHDLILEKNKPDMVRLPYVRFYDEDPKQKASPRLMKEEKDLGIAKVAQSVRVACWTKAIRRELFVPFPENTLFEDVVQHIAQCDVTNTVVWFSRPVVIWHIHSSSTSHNNSPKWRSSAWRFVADLMDLELRHGYCDARRKAKIDGAKRNLLEGKAIQ